MLSLFFGSRSKGHEYTTTYNGLSFKTRLRQFFRHKTYKAGQIIKPGNHELRLIRFVRYNNCFDEYWECEFVEFKDLGIERRWLQNEF